MTYIIGIDEVGRGPIAGPLVVCACALKKGVDVIQFFPKQILKDSKKLTEKNRKKILESLLPFQESQDVFFGLGEVSAEKIDTIGLSASIREAILGALMKLHEQGISQKSFVFLDGSLHAPETYQQETVIKGDEKILEISLASIYAKEYRDSKMKEYGELYPPYNFEQHVGYGTKAHYKSIKENGLTPLHRRLFLRNILEK